MARRLAYSVLISIIMTATILCASALADGPSKKESVQMVYDAIYNDKDAFSKYCRQSRDGMRSEITAVIVRLAQEGKISGDFEDIGSTAGPMLGRKCYSK